MSFIGGLLDPKRMGEADALLKDSRGDNYDFIVTSLPHASHVGARSDLLALESKWWSTSIVGAVTSPSQYLSTTDATKESTTDVNDMKMVVEEDSNFTWDKGEALIEALCGLSANNTQHMAEEHLSFMLDWAGHMTIPAVLLPSIPKAPEAALSYGRFLATQCLNTSASNVQLWLRIPFTQEGIQRFCLVHKLCEGPSNLGCLLEFHPSWFRSSSSSNSFSKDQLTQDLSYKLNLLHQIVGCNLRAVSFDTEIFLTNKKGFPTLSKSCQFLFTELLKRLGRTCRILVEGESRQEGGYVHYLQYLRHLRSKEDVCQALDTEERKMELNYLDHLQSALQPLGDNLEYSTYETFERDPVKYERYQRAVELALMDKIRTGQLRMEENSKVHALIVVVGAGRGPLVQASLNAVANVNQQEKGKIIVSPKIIAVEKNPSAVLYLHSLRASHIDWTNSVDIVECDMRYADQDPLLSKVIEGKDADKADIVVSELLGSFGDNELSPECLDGVQRCGLLKTTCVSIPQKYTSLMSPVTSMRLHSEAQGHAYMPSNALEGPGGKPCGLMHAMETPYVVRSHAAAQTHSEMVCWDFVHPLKDSEDLCTVEAATKVNNERHATVLFTSNTTKGVGSGEGYGPFNRSLDTLASISTDRIKDTTIHGFLGTFHCILYKSENEESIISIAPNSFSVGMFSWFPLYFPLKEPLLIPVDSSIRCNIWRKTDSNGKTGSRVWYEWCAEVLGDDDSVLNISSLHNPNGRSSHVRL